MTNPEKTVEEIVEELRPVIRDYREMPIEPNIWIHITAVKEALSAERQKLEEAVEAERKFWEQIVANQKVEIEMLRVKPDKQIFITQPNNPTSENN